MSYQLPAHIQKILTQARKEYQPIILVTAVFDVLHAKHHEFLRDAKALGGVLVVGLESDARVKKMKVESRPYTAQLQRVKNLENLHIADGVFLLSEAFGEPAEREALIAEIRPNFLAVSSHSLHQKEKNALLEKYGGKLVVVTDYDPAFSSTQLIDQLTTHT